MKWFFVFLDKDKEFSIEFCKTIHEIFLDGFGLEKGWSIERIRNERLKKSSILGLLKDNNNFHGYAFYTIPDVLLDGFHVLWEDAICIKKEHQGKGYSKSILTSICELYPNFKFGFKVIVFFVVFGVIGIIYLYYHIIPLVIFSLSYPYYSITGVVT